MEENNGDLAHLELPPDWRAFRLGDLFTIQQGKAVNQRTREGNNQQPFLRTANVFWGKLDLTTLDRMHFEADEMQRLALQPGDLLTCEGGDVGRTVIWRGELQQCFHQNHVHRLRTPRSDVEPEFYMRWMEAAITLLGLYAGAHNKTTIPNLSKSRLASFVVPHPPLPEQRAIAAVLRTVQRGKEACERVLAATRQLKQSLLHRLFTYGPVPFPQAAHVPLKETEIGPVPATWAVARVGDMGDVVTGTTPSTKRPEYYGGPYMFIAPGDLGGSKYIAKTEKWLSREGLGVCRSLSKNAVVVVCIGATIGKTGLTTQDECATNQQCNSVVTNNAADPEFLFYALSNRASALPELAGRAAVPIVNKSNFCEFKIALPPLPEQREIAAQLSAVDAKLAAEESRRAALAALFQSLLHQLMTGKVQVNDPQTRR